MQPEPDEPDYEVGYGKPPKATRFKQGQSGNPKGRPRREKTLDRLLSQVLDEKLTITEPNGRERKIAKRVAIFKQVVNRAVKGDTKAFLDVFRMFETFHRDYQKLSTEEAPLPRNPSVVAIIPHNYRDDLALLQHPELTRRLVTTEREWRMEQQRKQNPANDNGDDTARELKKA
jgi:hypothetical protein